VASRNCDGPSSVAFHFVYEPLAFPYAGVVVGVANEVDDRDWRKLPLIERKEILRDIVPEESRSILFAKHVPWRGCDFFAAVCEQDLEGIVAKAAMPDACIASAFAVRRTS
jgi:hypothetical protein